MIEKNLNPLYTLQEAIGGSAARRLVKTLKNKKYVKGADDVFARLHNNYGSKASRKLDIYKNLASDAKLHSLEQGQKAAQKIAAYRKPNGFSKDPELHKSLLNPIINNGKDAKKYAKKNLDKASSIVKRKSNATKLDKVISNRTPGSFSKKN
jgi:hypothetical protein